MKILADFFPIVLFFVVFNSYDDMQQGIMAATAVLVVATLLQLAWSWLRHRRVERMPLITAVLVVVFGGITLLLQDEVYIKWKPTVINWLFAVAFLASRWIGQQTLIERMMGNALSLPKPVWARLNVAWVIFFMVSGALNLAVAFNFSTDIWVDFKLFGMLGLTLLFVILQGFYLSRYLQPDSEQEEKP